MGRRQHWHEGNWITEQAIQQTDAVVKATDIDPLLYDLLATPTPHGSEERLRPWLKFLDDKKSDVSIDKLGNIILDIGKPGVDFHTIFSCHMDTVHATQCKDISQDIYITKTPKDKKSGNERQEGMLYAAYTKTVKDKGEIEPMVLGGDDKLGVYVILKMIEAKIPGRYMFHVGEEKGCIGSAYIADKHKEFLTGMKRAIAFDRMGYSDVIAHQRGDRCGSIAFTNALADGLNLTGFIPPVNAFKGDIRGMSTDTANYVRHVPECSNLSIGYFDNHGDTERGDWIWLSGMFLPAVLAFAKTKDGFEGLPTDRDPHKPMVPVTVDQIWRGPPGPVPYNKITAKTFDMDLPPWHPKDGWVTEAGYEGMTRLIRHYMERGYPRYQYPSGPEHNSALTKVFADLHNAKIEILHLQKALESKANEARFKIAFRSKAIEKLKLRYDWLLTKGSLAEYSKYGASTDLAALSDETRSTLMKVRHVSFLFRAFFTDARYMRLKLGLDLNDTTLVLVNKYLLEITLAGSNFVDKDKRFKRMIKDIYIHMRNNADDPVFVKIKPQLEAHAIMDHKDLKGKVDTKEPFDPDKIINKCNDCKGTGWTRTPTPTGKGAILEKCKVCKSDAGYVSPQQMAVIDCPICEGTGVHHSAQCQGCMGKRVVPMAVGGRVENLGSTLPVVIPGNTNAKQTVH